jgi:alpha-L-fucosidase
MNQSSEKPDRGQQRLPVEKLRAWESLGYGMFICFGMSTFLGQECPDGTAASTTYAPDRLDVDQWISVARDAGMKYAVLTVKHAAGHCLWPSRLTDYHVGTSGNPTDVVEAYVRACEKRGLMAGLYYCSWDNHNRFGSRTWGDLLPGEPWEQQYTTREYQDFQTAQMEELLTQYSRIGEVWIDIPYAHPRGYRNTLYARIAELQPDTVIVMNSGTTDGSPSSFRPYKIWPTDIITIERFLPSFGADFQFEKWRQIEGKTRYMPGEVCDPTGKDWFYVENDSPRPDAELLGMYLVTRSRGVNFLLDVGPDRHGLIPDYQVDALLRLRKNIEHTGFVD